MSTQDNIRESMQGVIEHYTQNPEKALGPDSEAIAVIEEGLRVRASGPNGQSLVCDMPKGLGGGATAPSPGWTMRATLANCEAIMIALRAAQLSIELKTLEVRVDSLSDDRGTDDVRQDQSRGAAIRAGERYRLWPVSAGRLCSCVGIRTVRHIHK